MEKVARINSFEEAEAADVEADLHSPREQRIDSDPLDLPASTAGLFKRDPGERSDQIDSVRWHSLMIRVCRNTVTL